MDKLTPFVFKSTVKQCQCNGLSQTSASAYRQIVVVANMTFKTFKTDRGFSFPEEILNFHRGFEIC